MLMISGESEGNASPISIGCLQHQKKKKKLTCPIVLDPRKKSNSIDHTHLFRSKVCIRAYNPPS